MFPEHQFAVVRLQSENLTEQEALRLNNEYKADKDYSNIHYLLIIVGEKFNPGFRASELEKLSRIYRIEPQTNNHEMVVWLVSEPLATAMAHIFVSYTNEKYCSTLFRAFELLDMPIDYPQFSSLINHSDKPLTTGGS
ncbi:MAG: hypothetical protein JXB00_07015 [Bacteroidales bacterium]|nr:hypothetical protein [Bacteroidales bacterium]